MYLQRVCILDCWKLEPDSGVLALASMCVFTHVIAGASMFHHIIVLLGRLRFKQRI